jgi:hypothetical protein
MNQRYSIADRASTGSLAVPLQQVLETTGMFLILSDENDANLACRAYKLIKELTFY